MMTAVWKHVVVWLKLIVGKMVLMVLILMLSMVLGSSSSRVLRAIESDGLDDLSSTACSSPWVHVYLLVSALLVAGLIEEAVKGFVLQYSAKLYLPHPAHLGRAHADTLVWLGLVIRLGFGSIEGVLYGGNKGAASQAILLLVRVIIAIPFHSITGAMWGTQLAKREVRVPIVNASDGVGPLKRRLRRPSSGTNCNCHYIVYILAQIICPYRAKGSPFRRGTRLFRTRRDLKRLFTMCTLLKLHASNFVLRFQMRPFDIASLHSLLRQPLYTHLRSTHTSVRGIDWSNSTSTRIFVIILLRTSDSSCSITSDRPNINLCFHQRATYESQTDQISKRMHISGIEKSDVNNFNTRHIVSRPLKASGIQK